MWLPCCMFFFTADQGFTAKCASGNDIFIEIYQQECNQRIDFISEYYNMLWLNIGKRACIDREHCLKCPSVSYIRCGGRVGPTGTCCWPDTWLIKHCVQCNNKKAVGLMAQLMKLCQQHLSCWRRCFCFSN